MQIPEILAPAGNRETLETACLYGANAVYLGVKGPVNLRAKAGNFALEDLPAAVAYAHERGVKVYLTMNTYPHDEDMQLLPPIIEQAASCGVDAVIVSDMGVLSLLRELAPDLAIHLSTQANTINTRAVNAWGALGVSRVVLARELNATQIAHIRKNTDVELEIFIHGSMCISISGRCLISDYLCERGANRGLCAQPCRWDYALVERTRPGQYMPVFEENGQTHLFNSKDLCLLPHWDTLMRLGLHGFKIEGRNRAPLYVATATAVYRQACDAWLADPENFHLDEGLLEEIKRMTRRDYFSGFFMDRPDHEGIEYDMRGYEHSHHLAAKVLEAGGDKVIFEARNPLLKHMELEWMAAKGQRIPFPFVDATSDGKKIGAAKPGQIFEMSVPFAPQPGELIRKPYSEGDRVLDKINEGEE